MSYTRAFSGGVTGIQGYGDRWQIMFSGTWAAVEKWGIIIDSDAGKIDVGSINFFAANTAPLYALPFKNRMYLAESNQVNFSSSGPADSSNMGGPFGWNQQDLGAGLIRYLSSFGGNDLLKSLSQLQGRLVIVARRSVQIWTVDADPANFALVQELDNVGTNAPFSVQNIGDYDVIMLDDTGYRSLRAKEVTLNAYPDDLGTPIDSLVRADLLAVGPTGARSIVEPTTKNVWQYLNGKIYVFFRQIGSKIQAWSTYSPTFQQALTGGSFSIGGSLTITGLTVGQYYNFTLGNATSITSGANSLTADGELVAGATTATVLGPISSLWSGSLVGPVTFTPDKFIVQSGVVYCRTTERYFITYSPLLPDGSICSFQLPWLDAKTPATIKTSSGIDVAIAGAWLLRASMSPHDGTFENQMTQGVAASAVMTASSTFDNQRYAYEAEGTHLSLIARTRATRTAVARFAMMVWHYKLNNKK